MKPNTILFPTEYFANRDDVRLLTEEWVRSFSQWLEAEISHISIEEQWTSHAPVEQTSSFEGFFREVTYKIQFVGIYRWDFCVETRRSWKFSQTSTGRTEMNFALVICRRSDHLRMCVKRRTGYGNLELGYIWSNIITAFQGLGLIDRALAQGESSRKSPHTQYLVRKAYHRRQIDNYGGSQI